MKNDKKGSSTCKPGEERFEKGKASRTLVYLSYEYRHTDGQLFTTAAPNLFTARDRRDKWLKELRGSKPIASAPVKDLMKQACEEIKRLTEDRNAFLLIAKQYVQYIEETASYKREPLENLDYVKAKETIEEYENRPKRTSACKKSG